jgi:hypothetical protein
MRKAEQVLEAIKVMIATALPTADVARNAAKPKSIGAGGAVFIRDGDPGEPDVILSPIRYTYSHRVSIELGLRKDGTKSKEMVADDMMTAINHAIEANRTLGGLCEWMEPDAPVSDDMTVQGAEAGLWVEFGIIATYTTTSPLG